MSQAYGRWHRTQPVRRPAWNIHLVRQSRLIVHAREGSASGRAGGLSRLATRYARTGDIGQEFSGQITAIRPAR